ncbi:MAG: MFS transporter [Oscillospiraceae bacterium]|jgi:GPH family glycoside/pentoside/hexuronide:cation symporter/probable glucitol transport protein GutA|nr:MFS transporter [Oscillospiraceae bacterium]
MKPHEYLEKIRANEQDPEKMKLKEYVGYALGSLCYGSIGHMASQYLRPFYLSLGMDPKRVGNILAGTKVYDSINDPIVALIIDNGKSKNGRFKPYLAKLVPLLALLSIFMFVKSPFGGVAATTAWCVLTYAIWETVNTFSSISFGAIGTVMSGNTEERTLYTTIGNMGQQLAGMVPGLIPFARDLTKGFLPESTFFTICAVIFAGIGVATGMFTKNLKERISPPEKQAHFWDSFVTFFQNKYLILLWSSTLSAIIGNAGNAYMFYQYALGSTSLQGIQWALAGAPHFLAVALAPVLLKRFRPSRIIIGCNLLNAVCYFVMYGAANAVGYQSTLGIIFIMCFSVIAWVPFGIGDVARNILQMNTFDYTALKTGKRAEATSLMVTGMLTKWAGALTELVVAGSLVYIGFKSGDSVVQTEATKQGMFFMFSIFPAIGSVLTVIPMLFFNLEGDEFKRRIAALEAEKIARA